MLPTSHHIYNAIATLDGEELARAAERHHSVQPRSRRRFFRRSTSRGPVGGALTPRQA
jgi:hypothetical protein